MASLPETGPLDGARSTDDAVAADYSQALLGFQAGVGARTIRRAYGHDVEWVAHLHDVDDIAALPARHGFAVGDALQRPACGHERQPQGFVMAHRH